MSGNPFRQVALIGFGEFGGIFGRDLAAAGISVSVFDILFNSGHRVLRCSPKQRTRTFARVTAWMRRFGARTW